MESLPTINASGIRTRVARVPASTTGADRATIRAAMYSGQSMVTLPDGTDVVIGEISEPSTVLNADEWITVRASHCARNRGVFYIFRSLNGDTVPRADAEAYIQSIRICGYVCLPGGVSLEMVG